MAERSPVELVIKAVQGLPDDERDRALAWLVDRNASAWGSGIRASYRRSRGKGEGGDPFGSLSSYGTLHGEHQSVLVRLPVEQHAHLREWCAQHHFSMATVVRGLVDRFLAQQPDAQQHETQQPAVQQAAPRERDAQRSEVQRSEAQQPDA